MVAFSHGASIPARRILCCTLLASSTVMVSPSAIVTTRPCNVSAKAVRASEQSKIADSTESIFIGLMSKINPYAGVCVAV